MSSGTLKVSIEVRGVDEAMQAFERYGDHAYNEVKRHGLSAALGITAKAKALAPVGVDGFLKANIHPDFPETGRLEFVSEVRADAGYAAYVEFGTRPHMPPVDAITPWALMHGIDPWRLAYHIKHHGTKAHPFMRPAFISEVPDYLTGLAAGLNVAALP